MAAVTQRVGNYLGGVSRQTDDKKTPGQVTELINGYPDVTIGLTKRPGFKFISTLKNSSGTAYSGTSLDGARWFYINRDTDTEKYIGCITAKVGNTNGTVLIWNANTGAACTVDSTTEDAIGIKQWVTNTTYKVGDKVRGISTNDSLRVYECIRPGKSGANGPTGTTSTEIGYDFENLDGIYDHTAYWAGNTAYAVNDVVRRIYTVDTGGNATNGGNAEVYHVYYKCTSAGTSGTSEYAPTGKGNHTETNTNPAVSWTYDGEPCTWKYLYTIGDYFTGTRDDYDVLTIQDTTLITNKTVTATAEATPDKPRLRTRQTLLYDATPIAFNNYHLMSTPGSTGAWTLKYHRNDGTTITRSGIHFSDPNTSIDAWLNHVGGKIVSEAHDHCGFDTGNGTSPYGSLAFSIVNGAIQLDCTTQLQAPNANVNPNIPEIKAREFFALEITNTDIPTTPTSGANQVLRDGYDPKTQLFSTFEENAATAASLPATSFHNHVWHVTNSAALDEDDYWVKFVADDPNQASDSAMDGHWVETVDPNVFPGLLDRTMPHELINTAANTFRLRPAAFTKRLVGDDLTNPAPSFIDLKIEKTFYHSNRLGFLAGDNVILSQAGEPFNFFHITARSQTDADPIDITCQSTRPNSLKNVLPTAGGLILFAKNQQFILLTEDNGILSPLTTSTKAISNFELDTKIDPIDFGSSFNFLSKTPGKSRVFAMVVGRPDEPPKALDISNIVDTWLPTTIDTLIASVQSQLLALSSQSSRDIYAFRTYNDGNKALMQSWFKWKLPGTVQHINIDNDDFYAVTKQGGNWAISLANLTQSPEDAIIVNNNGDKINPCMDLYKAASSVVYDSANDLSKCYLPFADDTNLSPVIVIAGDTSGGTYAESGFTITPGRGSDGTGAYFSVPGKNLTSVASNVIVGYRYDFDVKLPKTYFYDGNQIADYTASVTLARMKFAVGLSGTMGFKIKVKGRTEWYNVNPVVTADSYLANDVPLNEESLFTVPIHQRTENTEVRLFNDSPFPVSLNSMMWEGNYSPRFYRRT